ncbi:MAG: glycogen/starch synthase, partial [bacterium]|nr:glycogen/starch synthase [bacterium]
IGTLPRKLAALGCDVRVVLPYYRSVKENLSKLGIKPKDLRKRLVFCMDWLPVEGGIKEIELNGVTVYLLSNDEYYDPNTDIDLNRSDFKRTPVRPR